jgi:hypothetical protein
MAVDCHDPIKEMPQVFPELRENISLIVSLHFLRRSTPRHPKTPKKPGPAAPAPKKSAHTALSMG